MRYKILRLPELSSRIGLGRSAIYDRLNPKSPHFDPSFPRPVSLGSRAKGWIDSEADAWIEHQLKSREESTR